MLQYWPGIMVVQYAGVQMSPDNILGEADWLTEWVGGWVEEGRVGGVGAVVLVRLGEGIGWGRIVSEEE